MGWWWVAKRVFGSGLVGSDARAGIYADAIPSFTEDLPAFGNNALLLCALSLEGDMPLRKRCLNQSSHTKNPKGVPIDQALFSSHSGVHPELI